MSKHLWNDGKIARLRELFPTGYNDEIADELGMSVSSVKRMARRLGLKKAPGLEYNQVSPEVKDYILELYETLSLRDIQAESGITLPTLVKIINEAAVKGFKKKTKAEIGRLIGKKRKKMYAREYRLAVMGFYPETRIRVMPNRKRWRYRSQLKRSGYDIMRCGCVAYVYLDTVRHHNLERLAKKNGIDIVIVNFNSLPDELLGMNGDAEIDIAAEEGFIRL